MPGGWPWDLTSPSTVGYHEKILLLQIQARKSSVKTSRTHFLLKKNISMFWIKILSCFTGVCLKNQKNPWMKAPQTHKNAQFYPNWPHSFILRMQRKITHHLRNALRKAKKKQEAFLALRLLGHLNGTFLHQPLPNRPNLTLVDGSDIPKANHLGMVQFTTCKSWGETTINHFEVDSWNPIIYKVCFGTIQPVLGPWDLTSPSTPAIPRRESSIVFTSPGNDAGSQQMPSLKLRKPLVSQLVGTWEENSTDEGTRTGVPLTYVYPWYLAGVLEGFLGIITHVPGSQPLAFVGLCDIFEAKNIRVNFELYESFIHGASWRISVVHHPPKLSHRKK